MSMTLCARSVAKSFAIAASRVTRARAVVLGPGGAIDQQRRRIDIDRHLGDVALHHLQIGERAAEQFARSRARLTVSSSARRAKAERGGADGRAKNIERRHGDLKAFAGRADHGRCRNA